MHFHAEEDTKVGGRTVPLADLFADRHYGLAVAGGPGSALSLNAKAVQLLGFEPAGGRRPPTCCDLICEPLARQLGREPSCLGEHALEAGEALAEVRLDVGGGRAVWAAASPVGDPRERLVIFHLRSGPAGDRRADRRDESTNGKPLRISALGPLRVELDERPLDGSWLDQLHGQLFKYLLVQRGRPTARELIAEALWPQDAADAVARVRYRVHALREILEPGRPRRAPARFVLARGGGYQLARDSVWVDADAFEDEVNAGLVLFVQGEMSLAAARLERGLCLYNGDFLADDPYAESALAERDRLRELAARGLRALVRLRLDAGQIDVAAEPAQRLAEMEPLDDDAQRQFIEICMRQGRRTEALRRYDRFRSRARQTFGAEPEFRLSDLNSRLRAESGSAGIRS